MTTSRKAHKGAGRPAGGRAIDPEIVTRGALTLIDAKGLDALTLRSLATELGVSPATIHWHINSKENLLANVTSLVLRGVAPQRGKRTWQEWIAELFLRFRKAIRRHPNVSALVGAQLVSNASMQIEVVEGVLTCLEEAGFQGQYLVEAYNCTVAAMLGFVTIEFAPLPSYDPLGWSSEMRERVHSIRPLDHPVLARWLSLLANKAFIVRWENGVTAPMETSFRRHIGVLIAGIESFAQEVRND